MQILCPFLFFSFAHLSQLIHDGKFEHPRNHNAHRIKVVLCRGYGFMYSRGIYPGMIHTPDSPVTFVRV